MSLIGFEKETTFPGFSHGTAGTAWMFAIIYKATKDEKYLELAKEGAKYLQGIAVGDEEAVLIPYQDHPVTGPTNDKFYLGTCHGPAGHTLLFRMLYEITGEEEYKDWMIRISRGTIRAGAPEHFSWGFWNAQCQCCGTAGILEHFVHMYELTGEDEFLLYAKRTARVLISDSFVSDEEPDQRRWYLLIDKGILPISLGFNACIMATLLSTIIAVFVSLVTPKTPYGIIQTWFGKQANI